MIRKAKIQEVPEIRRFLTDQETHGIIPRSLAYLYAHLRDYFVSEEGFGEEGLDGIVALHLCWDRIGEIRSLVVREESRGNRIGEDLVSSCIMKADELDLKKIFLLTLIPKYFRPWGFEIITRDELPPIAWADCVNCIKFPNCNEVPMILEL